EAVGRSRHHPSGRPTLVVTAAPVLAELLGEWVDDQLERLDRCQGLAAAEEILVALTAWRARLGEVRPQARARIAGLDVAAVLARTLRAGVADELGWPALEKACAIVDGAQHPAPGLRGMGVTRAPAALRGQVSIALTEAWPALIVHRGGHVAAVAGPEDVLLVHHSRTAPQRTGYQDARLFGFVDGELLVARVEDGRWRGYWSARPDDEFELTGALPEHLWQTDGRLSLPLPDGGRTTGGRPLRAGGTALTGRRPVWGDGVGYWVHEGDHGKGAWTEFDPATGTRGGASLPPWLTASSRQCELPLDPGRCEVLPLQPGQQDTPLGTDGSLVGRWVRREPGRAVLGTPDGRVVRLPAHLDLDSELPVASGQGPAQPIGLLRLPGGAELLLVQRGARLLEVYRSGAEGRREDLVGQFVTSAAGGLCAAGTAVVVGPPFWHNLRPRDKQGSHALRRLTDAEAAELLAAARPREHAEDDEDKAWVVVAGARLPRTRAELLPVEEVARLLPQVTDPLLRAGVAGHVLHAVTLQARAAAFRPVDEEKRLSVPPRPVEQYRPPFGDDYRIRMLTSTRDGYEVARGAEAWTVLNQIRAVAALLRPADGTPGAGTPPSGAWSEAKHDIGHAHTPWVGLLHRLPDLTLRAVSATTPPEVRETLRLLLGELLQLPLGASRGGLRVVVLREPYDRANPAPLSRRGQVLRRGDRTVVILHEESRYSGVQCWLALEHDPSGQFGQAGSLTTEREHRVETHRDPALLRALLERAAADGPAPWRPEAAAALHGGTG
ncbi:MAG: hypothetical protein HOY69_19870, partial [Streptomyces sp.]|nr:hypothetical protein [Streptomyces sp.]